MVWKRWIHLKNIEVIYLSIDYFYLNGLQKKREASNIGEKNQIVFDFKRRFFLFVILDVIIIYLKGIY